MIKIAFVCSGISGGGAERFVVTMVNKFSKNKKFETLLITSEKTENEYTLATSVTRKCILKNNYLLDSKAIREYLRAQKIEVAIFIGIYANLCGCLANFFLKTKIIISERNAPKQDNLSRKTKILRRILYRFADYYVFQTEGAKKFYSKKIQRKSRVIPNPVLDDLPMR